MRRYRQPWKNAFYLIYRWVSPFVDPIRLMTAFPGLFLYLRDWFRYSRMSGAESIRWGNTSPQLHDRSSYTPFDRHYFYQDIWAFKHILQSAPSQHVDVGSRIDLVGFLTCLTHVKFVDIRPLEVDLSNYDSVKGDILSLPFESGTLTSLSCLNVAEHIGLGRYGDPLEPDGTKKAAAELARVLAPGGVLYFSLPVGKPRLCFNAHRIHSPEQVLSFFPGLELKEFSGIDDGGGFQKNADLKSFALCDFGCGLFRFVKPSRS